MPTPFTAQTKHSKKPHKKVAINAHCTFMAASIPIFLHKSQFIKIREDI